MASSPRHGLDRSPRKSLGHHPNPNPIDVDPGLDGGVVRQAVGSNKFFTWAARGRWRRTRSTSSAAAELAANFFARQGY
jgi:hypothetical protein